MTMLLSFHVVFAKYERVFENLIQLHRSALGFVLTGEAQEILHDVMGALRLLIELFEVTRAARIREFFGL